MYHIAIHEETNEAMIVDFKLSLGIKPKLPKYRILGGYDTKNKAKKSLPKGVKFEGKMVGEKDAKPKGTRRV